MPATAVLSGYWWSKAGPNIFCSRLLQRNLNMQRLYDIFSVFEYSQT